MKASFLAFAFSVLHFILYKKPVFWRLWVKDLRPCQMLATCYAMQYNTEDNLFYYSLFYITYTIFHNVQTFSFFT